MKLTLNSPTDLWSMIFGEPLVGARLNGRLAARVAALLLITSGGVSLSMPLLTAPDDANRLALVGVCAGVVLFGVLTWCLPWQRWHRGATVWIIPPSLALMAAFNGFAGDDTYRYSLFFMAGAMWIGATQPRSTAVRFSPLLALAYVTPLLIQHRPAWALLSAVYAVPVCVVAGEVLSWVIETLERANMALQQSEERLAHLATHDRLSSLPNRGFVLDRVSRCLSERGASLAMVFLDLDNLKAVNDRYGHDAGDRLIRAAAERIRAAVRTVDMVGRLGGDEFVVVAEGLDDADQAVKLAERISAHLRAPFWLEGESVGISASIGIALGRSELDTAESLLRDADSAMYTAKRRGKNGWALFAPCPSNGSSAERSDDLLEAAAG